MDAKQFKKNIGLIKKGAARFDMIHQCAVFALNQINGKDEKTGSPYGQTTPANELLSCMHKADRIEALKTWFHDFGKVVTVKDGTLKYSDKKEIFFDGEKIEPMQAIDYAEATPYFDYTKEIKPASSYDVMKGLKNILTRVKAMKTKGGTVEHEEMIAKIVSLIPE